MGIINKTSISLRNNTLTMNVGTKLFASLIISIVHSVISVRTNWLPKKNPNGEYKDKLKEKEMATHVSLFW